MAIVSLEEPVPRLARAIVFATVCVVVTAGGHAFAGGGPVGLGLMAASVAGAAALAYALNGRERGPRVVLGATVCAQAVLHQAFAVAAPPPEVPHAHAGLGMPLVHLMLAGLSGWWLHRGERAAWLMLRLWGAPRLLLAAPAAPPVLVRGAPVAYQPEPRATTELDESIPRRGPPAGRGVRHDAQRVALSFRLEYSPWHSSAGAWSPRSAAACFSR
ncbi:hypothetical protein ABT294_09910 [Nonomuraea sp. NPDC000554]|uniref:hypothetical protein n=1 Tax=Nonomuraea sp. NPDC000554 TaxID=3154259 RepID=UPI00332D8CAE